MTETSPRPITDHPLMEGVDILTIREGGLSECYLPIDRVDNTDVPIDEGKLDDLIADMRAQGERHGGTGQKSPTRISFVDGEQLGRIVDGFHRFTALKSLGHSVVYSTVEVLPLDELLDERIRNANVHDNVRFARTAEWMNEAWELHPLSDVVPITSAFQMAHFEDYKGVNYNLTLEDVESCAAWAQQKAEVWGSTPSSLYQVLKSARDVAPELVHNVRPARARVRPDTINLSPAIVNAFSAKIPEEFDVQRAIAQAVKDNKIPSSSVAKLAEQMSGMTAEAASDYLELRPWIEGTKRTFKFSEEQILRLGLVRNSSAVEPLMEISQATYEAFHEADLSKMPLTRLEVLKRDLERTSSRVLGMIATVNSWISDMNESNKANYEQAAAWLESTEDLGIASFLTVLGGALEDDGKLPDITTDEQCQVCEAFLSDDSIGMSISDNNRRLLTMKVANFRSGRT